MKPVFKLAVVKRTDLHVAVNVFGPAPGEGQTRANLGRLVFSHAEFEQWKAQIAEAPGIDFAELTDPDCQEIDHYARMPHKAGSMFTDDRHPHFGAIEVRLNVRSEKPEADTGLAAGLSDIVYGALKRTADYPPDRDLPPCASPYVLPAGPAQSFRLRFNPNAPDGTLFDRLPLGPAPFGPSSVLDLFRPWSGLQIGQDAKPAVVLPNGGICSACQPGAPCALHGGKQDKTEPPAEGGE